MTVYHLLVAKVGFWPALTLGLYAACVLYLVIDLAVSIGQYVYYRLLLRQTRRNIQRGREALPFVRRQKGSDDVA